jgi:hypothetical protein
VVENVEELKAELKYFRFGDVRILQQCHVEIVNTRTLEHPLVRRPQLPKASKPNTVGSNPSADF